VLLGAAGLVWAATRGVGPVAMPQFTELRQGPLQEHLVTVDGLNMSRTFQRHHYPMLYPGGVAAGINTAIARGFSMFWQPAQPQAAALPADQG
jgi:hypothetical protein